jgi:hypothetical protein
MSPLGVGAARPAGIPASRRRSRPGKGRSGTRGSPRTQLRPKKGVGRLRRGGSATPTGGGRGTAGTGEVAAPWGKRARRRARAGVREGGGRSSWLCGGSTPGFRRGGLRWRGVGGAQELEAAQHARQRGGDPFIGDARACSRPVERQRHLGGARDRTNDGRTNGP